MKKTETQNGIFRKRENPFPQVSNAALRDENLSLKAKGLYSLIQSYITLPEFTLYKFVLQKQCGEGKRAFDSAWKELKDAGYLKQYRTPSGSNGYFIYEYELLAVADLSQLALMNLKANGEVSGNNHVVQNVGDGENPEKKANHTLHFVPHAKRSLCEVDPMQNGGGINNTNVNNIDNNNTDPSVVGGNDSGVEKKLITKEHFVKQIEEQIGYAECVEKLDIQKLEVVDMIVGFMAELLSSKRKSVRIGNRTVKMNVVKEAFSQVNSDCVDRIAASLRNSSAEIRNLRQYVWESLVAAVEERGVRGRF